MLHNIQNGFKEFIADGSVNDALQECVNVDGISLEKRLGIYLNNVIGNLTESLKITYPNFVQLVGDEFFAFLAAKYIPKNLPETGALFEYGQNFAEFVKSVPQLEEYPYAHDFVRLEWLHHVCSYYPSEQTLTLQKLAQIVKDNPEYTPNLKKSVQLFKSKHPIKQLWDMCRSGKEQALKIEGDAVVIFQHNGEPSIETVTENEFQLLNVLGSIGNELPKISAEEASLIIRKYISLGVFQLVD